MEEGYPNEPTTKDTSHLRRSKGKKGKKGIRVKFTLLSKLSISKEKFLLNKENKQEFNECLISYMNSCNIEAFQAHDDADVLVATTAVDSLMNANVVVIGEDTDILILLLHYYNMESNNNIFFTTDKNIRDKKIWNIREVKNKLPSEIVECILPIHAFLGCDAVSRVYSIGKGEESLNKIIGNEEFIRYFMTFNKEDAEKGDIADSGEKILCLLYSGYVDKPLNSLRYAIFCKKGSTGKIAVTPESLPPTSNAAL